MMAIYDDEGERVTAALTSHLPTGENFEGALSMGYYAKSELDEIWIEFRNQRINIQCSDIPALCKQLRRTAKLAAESAQREKLDPA